MLNRELQRVGLNFNRRGWRIPRLFRYIKFGGIGINITRNQETAFGVSLQSYFGAGKRQPFPPFILM